MAYSRENIDDLILFNTYNTNGTNANLQAGTSYIRYGCYHPDQGHHEEVCDGYNTGRTSKLHNMEWDIYGRSHIVLYDVSANKTTNLVYGSDRVDSDMDLDPTHYYSIMIDAYGGTTTVTCNTCGYGKSFKGSYSVYVKAYGTYQAYVRTQPTPVSLNCGETATFKVSGVNCASYQWQIKFNGNWTSVIDGNIGTKGINLSGCKNTTFKIEQIRTDFDGLYVRCVLTGLDYKTLNTDEVLLTVVDNAAPSITINRSTEDPTSAPVILEVIASDPDSGLPANPYSFDGGLTYQKSNIYTVTQNSTVEVRVTDLIGNIASESVVITNIDGNAPYIGINNVARKVKKIYIGVDMIAREVNL